jgi:hypothetical protein
MSRNPVTIFENPSDGHTYRYDGISIIAAPTLRDGHYDTDPCAQIALLELYQDPHNNPPTATEVQTILARLKPTYRDLAFKDIALALTTLAASFDHYNRSISPPAVAALDEAQPLPPGRPAPDGRHRAHR